MGRKNLGVRKTDASMAASVSEAAAPDEHAGGGRFEEISVAKISGNERNPRFQAVRPDQVRELRAQALAAAGDAASSGAGDSFFGAAESLIEQMDLTGSEELSVDESHRRLHGILGLARSINRVNLIQPITLYPHNTGYEVVAGQRRYLAHLLLGRTEIRAIVRQPSGDRLDDSLAAVVENLAREELSLRERMEAISEIVELHEVKGESMTGPLLQSYLGESVRNCQRYLRILREAPVREAIRSGEVTSLRQAAQLVDPGADQEKPADRRDREGTLTRTTPVDASHPGGAAQKNKASRPKTRVQLGSTFNCEEVYRVMAGFLTPESLDSRYPDVDWSDFSEVEAVWKSFWSDYIADGDEGS